MPQQFLSICSNSPLGGPTSNKAADRLGIDGWQPGDRACMSETRWPNGSTLRVGFIDMPGDYGQFLRQQVKEVAPTWSLYANVKFEFVEGPTRDITIRFEPVGVQLGSYKSQLGTISALFSGRGEPSMYLAFVENPRPTIAEYRRAILHEFGHALGLIHEHSRPDAPLDWDEEALRNYYIVKTAAQWTWDDIKEQVVDPYNGMVQDQTEFDPHSIMMYPFPANLAKYKDGRPFQSDWNLDLSELDKTFIAKMYPR